MTRIALLPFYSQQDKQTGKFLLHSCVATKHIMFMAHKIHEELGWKIRLLVPQLKDCQTLPAWDGTGDMLDIHEVAIPAENMAQRLEWYPHRWPTLFKDVDILFTSHELIGWAIKGAYPKMKVIQHHNLSPETAWPWMSPLFDMNYEKADVITCLSPSMRQRIRDHLAKQRDFEKAIDGVQLWPFAWNIQQLHDPIQSQNWAPPERDIDLLFVLRGSSTNYSHHVEFIAALKVLREIGWQGKVYFPDQTRYLTENKLLEGIENVYVQEGTNKNLGAYTRLLRRSKAVIGLCDNGFGGESIREAIACGAFPILLNCDGYKDLVDKDWPGLLSNMGAEYMAGFIQGIFESGLYERATKDQLIHLTRNMNAGEYGAVWARNIKPTLLKLIQG
jgi:hypothetical protein